MIMDGMSWNPQFTVLDKASTYWYHPHFHGKTAEHAIKGAAGIIIVRDNEEAQLNLPRTYGVDDFPIVVQSAQLDSVNQFMPFGMQDSTVFVNGVRANYGSSAYLDVPAQVVRLRLLNAAGERTFNFGFTGNMPFKIIGSDGGLLSAPVNATRIRISPGERYEILIDFSSMNGQNINLMSFGSELPMGVQGGPTMPMPPGNPPMDSPLNGVDFNILQLNVGSPTANPVTIIPTTLVNVSPIPAAQSNVTRPIEMSAQNMMSMDGPFFFNDSLFDMDRIDYIIPINNTEIWELTNSTMVAHPFHIHDVQFYVLDRDGNLPPPQERGRKDVVFVLPQETVRFITKFETFTDTVVPYPFHCHILMHEDDGMMGNSTHLNFKNNNHSNSNNQKQIKMKKQITTAAFLLTAVMFMASCGNKTSESKKEDASTEQTVNAMYQCPMKCEGEKMYDKPGSCPVCNMDLEKVEGAHEHHEHDSTHTNH